VIIKSETLPIVSPLGTSVIGLVVPTLIPATAPVLTREIESTVPTQPTTQRTTDLMAPVESTYIAPTSLASYSTADALTTQSITPVAVTTARHEKVYIVENRVTDYICPKIVQVYSASQIAGHGYSDAVQSVMMFR
jgi:hypothetical protein